MSAPIWLRRTGRTLNNNSTSILSAAAVGGVVVTAILSVRAANKIAEREEVVAEPTPKQYVQQFWRDYIPPAAAGVATIACIIGANQIGLRKQAAMLGAYTLADTAFREYKEEVVGLLGEKKDQAITDKVAARKIDENPPVDNQVIITGGGDQLCYDTLSGRYFNSDVESIRRAANDVNEEIIGGNMWASLNEFWARLGLADTTLGEELGFNLEHLVELTFTPHITKDGKPCLAVTHSKLPVANYGQVV